MCFFIHLPILVDSVSKQLITSSLFFIFKELIKNFLNSREELFRWIYEIHNKVNHKLGVPSCDIPSFEKVYSQYESYRAKCHKYTSKERKSRKEKGCTRPLHSKSRQKCIIKIISNKSRKKSRKKK